MNLRAKVVRARVLWVAVAVALAISALGVWAQNASLVGVNYDDGIYALLARSVAQGEGYRLNYLPQPVAGVKYPPLYPLSLVPFWTVAPSQPAALDAMKVANGIYIGVAAGLFVLLLVGTGLLSLPMAVLVSLLGFAAGSMMLVTSGLLSEPLYLALLFLGLWAADSVPRDASWPRVAFVGALAALVALTRTVGLAAVAAALLSLWLRGGRRPAAVAGAAAALVLAPWASFSLLGSTQVPDVLVPRYGSYLQLYLANTSSSPLAALDILFANVGAILQTLGAKLLPVGGALLRSLMGGLLLLLAVLGTLRTLARAPATASYPWFYLAAVSMWSFPPFRFVFILFPLLLALAAVGVRELLAKLGEEAGAASGDVSARGRSRDAPQPVDRLAGVRGMGFRARSDGIRLALVTLVLLVVAQLAFREGRSVVRRVWDGAELRKSAVGQEVIDWVERETEPRDVVAYEFEPMIALHTGRHAVPNNYEPVHVWYQRQEPPVEPLARLLRLMGVDYLAVRREIPAVARPIDTLLGTYPGALELLSVTPRGALIFRVEPEALFGEPAFERPGAAQ